MSPQSAERTALIFATLLTLALLHETTYQNPASLPIDTVLPQETTATPDIFDQRTLAPLRLFNTFWSAPRAQVKGE